MSNPPEQHRDVQPSGRRSRFSDTEFMSFNEIVRRMFENLFRGLEQQYHQLGIGWSGLSTDMAPFQYSFGNSVGQIVNNTEKFAVEMNVSQFHPDDLKVSLRHGELSIEGNQKQQRDQHGYIERHFIRRLTLPDDVDETTLTSHLKDNGILEISARKKNVPPTTPTRNIPIQTHNADQHRSRSLKRSDSSGSRTGISNH
uniref:SHSP domain-containing protein n=1 Tax=Elaeophora elaphi TaxID=1147741 RepID=A0A0R3S0V3_9BILA